ncbi:hypothetical protein BN1182_BF_00040 [Pantoea ananatis]|nr:hypothetical protein BN1182_BF_00040 [Pantoea ananatis]
MHKTSWRDVLWQNNDVEHRECRLYDPFSIVIKYRLWTENDTGQLVARILLK